MLQESSIDEPQIRDFEPTFHDDITYTVVNGATKREKAMLIDNQGYTYNIKRRCLDVTDWQCSVRPKDHPCRATVKQKNNDLFERNTCSHNHPGEPGAITAAKISVSVKQKATEDLFKPASAIVDEVFLDNIDDRPCHGTSMEHLSCVAIPLHNLLPLMPLFDPMTTSNKCLLFLS